MSHIRTVPVAPSIANRCATAVPSATAGVGRTLGSAGFVRAGGSTMKPSPEIAIVARTLA
jgi:hypothetical protein